MLYRDHTIATIDCIARKLGIKPGEVRKQFFLEPATYEINFVDPVSIAGGVTLQQSFFVNSDSAFVICETRWFTQTVEVA